MAEQTDHSNNHVREIINEVLRSPAFRTNIENVIQQVSSSSRSPAPAQHTSIQHELRQLFPSVRPRVQPIQPLNDNRNRNLKRKRSNTCKNIYSEFYKDICLVPDPKQTKTYIGQHKVDAYKNGYIVSAVKLYKQWDENEIITKIREIFVNILPSTIQFEFLLPVQGKLIQPALCGGQKIDGFILSRLYNQKPVYIRTFDKINNYSSHTDEDEENLLSNDDILESDIEAAIQNSLQDSNSEENEENLLGNDNILESDIEAAIQNSLQDNISADDSKQVVNLENILSELNSKVSTENINILNINRDDVFNTALRGFQRKSFSPYKKMSVSFTDEDGIDNGGPSREMWRLLLSHLQNSNIFEGNDFEKNISYWSNVYEDKLYYEAGRIVAMSLVHGGPGPEYFSETLFNLITRDDIENIEPTFGEITDTEVKQEITSLMQAETNSDLENILENSSLLCVAGFKNIIPDISKRDTIINGAIKFYVIHRTRPAVEQFLSGLKTLDLLDKIKKHPEIFKPLFCYNSETLNAMKLRKIVRIVSSENGSTKKTIENKVVSFWWEYLQDCEENISDVTVTQVLTFMSGSDKVPPLGYPVQPTVTFLHGDTSPYPKSNTCTLELKLPVIHKDYKTFQNNMDFGILNGMMFALI